MSSDIFSSCPGGSVNIAFYYLLVLTMIFMTCGLSPSVHSRIRHSLPGHGSCSPVYTSVLYIDPHLPLSFLCIPFYLAQGYTIIIKIHVLHCFGCVQDCGFTLSALIRACGFQFWTHVVFFLVSPVLELLL